MRICKNCKTKVTSNWVTKCPECHKNLLLAGKETLIVLGLVIATFIVPYLTIPGVILWWFYKGSKFSKRAKIITTSTVGSLLAILLVWFGIAYASDAEPHLTITEPSTLTSTIKAPKITIMGTYSPDDRTVDVNGQDIHASNGKFTTVYQLKEGENKIEVQAGKVKWAYAYLTVTRELTDAEKAAMITPTTQPTSKPTNSPAKAVTNTPTPAPTAKPKQKITTPAVSQQIKNDYIKFYKNYMSIANLSDKTNNQVMNDLNAVSSNTSSMTTADLYLEASQAQSIQDKLKSTTLDLQVPNSLSAYNDDLNNAVTQLFTLTGDRSNTMKNMADFLNTNDLSKLKDIQSSTQDQQTAMEQAVVSIVTVGQKLGVDTSKIQVGQ